MKVTSISDMISVRNFAKEAISAQQNEIVISLPHKIAPIFQYGALDHRQAPQLLRIDPYAIKTSKHIVALRYAENFEKKRRVLHQTWSSIDVKI